MVAADGTNLPNTIAQNQQGFRKAIVESKLIHSLWSRVEVKINNTSIQSHVYHYGLKAHLDTLLSTSKQDQESLTTTTLFEKEKHFDSIWPNGQDLAYTSRLGWLKRIRKCTAVTSTFILRDRPKHFLFEQKKMPLPRTDVQIEFTKAKLMV